MLEVEVKIKVNLLDIEKRLTELDFKKGTTVYEMDTYYNGKVTDLKAEDKALRIREHKDMDSGHVKYVLNFKGPKLDDITMTRDETQFVVPSFELGEKVINGLGFFAAGYVEKTRVHYAKDNIICCLDTVTNLGEYLELEIMAENDDAYQNAVNTIQLLLNELGLKMEDTINSSYLSMLYK